MLFSPGDEIGPYRIVELSGRGGMASVYRAYHAALARHVAIKVLPDHLATDPEFRDRFRQEAVAVAGLRHANIPAVFDYGEYKGSFYIVSDFIDGGTLADQTGRPLPVEYVVEVLGPVASALDYAHARGVLHRDVKPSNILLARDGRAMLNDFGISKLLTSVAGITQAGVILGTPEYMAPEQCASGALGPPADIYSLAVVAYEMLTGVVPFSATTPTAIVLDQIRTEPPAPRSLNPGLSASVEAALLRGLAKAPEDRPRSAADFIRGVAAARSAESAAPHADPATPPAEIRDPQGRSGSRARARRVRARPAAIAGALLVATAVVVGSILLTHRGSSPGTPASTPPASAQQSAGPAKGALVWQAKLDGTADDFIGRFSQPNADAATLHDRPGALECRTNVPQSVTGAAYNVPPLRTYVTEMDFTIHSAGSFHFYWTVRAGDDRHAPDGTAVAPDSPQRTGDHNLVLDITGAQRTLDFQYDLVAQDGSVVTSIIGPTHLPDASVVDRPASLSVVVDPPRYHVYLNGRLVIDTTDARNYATAGESLGCASGDGTGDVSFTRLAVYRLP